MNHGALEDIRVLDLAGPLGWYATKLFADLGADVLRIEPPAGDPARGRPPFFHGDRNKSLPFWYFNTSKRSEIVDFSTRSGQERLRALAGDADIAFVSSLPGELAEHGFDYESVRERCPKLVWVSVTPFGCTGPYSAWKANDLILQAMGGLMFLAGHPGKPPTQLGGNQAEYLTGVLAAAGGLLALAARDRSGVGQVVDISGQESVSLDGENALPYWDIERWVRPRLGRKTYSGQTHLFEALDGWVILATGSRWSAFRGWLDKVGLLTPEWSDPKWESRDYRDKHPDDLDRLCTELVSRQTKAQAYLAGQQVRSGVAPIATIDELFADPQLAARGYWQSVPHPEQERDVVYPGAPFKLSHTPWVISRRAPLPGEHNGQGWKKRSTAPERLAHSDSQFNAQNLSRSAVGLPLSGIRIIDLSWVAAGPLGTRLLADHGADVIKVETHVHPDSSRTLRTARPAGNDSLNVSGMWNNLNTSKKSIALDLRNPGALRLLERLISLADVLVDNYGVDPYPKWGFTVERLRELRPDLIIARSSVMGRSGPRQHYIGFGYTIAAAAGHNSVTGFPGDAPAGACIAHPDYSSNPYHLAVAILAALHYRDRTGIGQTIDLSQHESTVSWLGPELMDFAANSIVAGPTANRRPDSAPHGAYPAAGDDRWIAIACETDAEFSALTDVMNRPELAADPRYATFAARKENEDALDLEVAAWTTERDPLDLMRRLQEAGVPAGAVQAHRDLVESDPQLAARGHYRRVEHPEAGLRTLDGPAVTLTATPSRLLPAPLLGQHNDSVFGDLLGLGEDELAEGYVEGWFT